MSDDSVDQNDVFSKPKFRYDAEQRRQEFVKRLMREQAATAKQLPHFPSVQKPDETVKRGFHGLYAQLSRKVASNPPVLYLSSFDLGLVAGLSCAVQASILLLRREKCLAAGNRQIAEERTRLDGFDKDWVRVHEARRALIWKGYSQADAKAEVKAPTITHTFDKKVRYELYARKEDVVRLAGNDGNSRMRRKLSKELLPEAFTLDISKTGWLEWACMSDDGKNLQALDDALPSLTKEVMEELPPLIRNYEVLPSGALRLTISGEWFNRSFCKVPMPFPRRSKSAVALYLFIFTISTARQLRGHMLFENLCARLGISTEGGLKAARRALNSAVSIVNRHLATLPVRKLDRWKCTPPHRIHIEHVGDGWKVRIVSTPYQSDDDGQLIVPTSKDKKRKVKRVMFSQEQRAEFKREARELESQEAEFSPQLKHFLRRVGYD